MKSLLLRAGLLTCLMLLSWSYEEASAESTWSSKCGPYGEIKPNQNPSLQHMNCLLTNAALEAKIPPEVVKAVATQESGWKQFDGNGQPIIAQDGGIGIMQITNQTKYDQQKLKYDIYYNIQAGVEILNSMYRSTTLPKIKAAGPEIIENWYFPVMAYNGIKPVNSPLYKSSGKKNLNAYQERVFAILEQYSFLNDTKLGQFPFSTADFEYDPNSDKNIVLKKKEYTLTNPTHASVYHFKTGDNVLVTRDNVNLRSQPSSSSIGNPLAKNTNLIIQGDFSYDKSLNSKNQFVWYPVKTADQKLAGYISSAYITKKSDTPLAPKVNIVTNKDTAVTGTAKPNTNVYVKIGSTIIGRGKVNSQGAFSITVPAQKLGTKISVVVMDGAGNYSPYTTVTVQNKTAPLAPNVNKITAKDTAVIGTAKPNTNVYVKIGSTIIGRGKVNSQGAFSITIPAQKLGTKISVVVMDGAGNYSPYTTVTVQNKTAPLAPNVNKITAKDTAVIGTAKPNTNVYVKIGSTIIGRGKVNSQGAFSITIPAQKLGTKISVVVMDGAGNYSPYTTVTVQNKTAPLAPNVNKITAKDTAVIGTAKPNTNVYVKIGSTIIGRGKVNSQGAFSITIPAQKLGTKISVVVMDGAGNYSPYTTVTVQNKTAPLAPNVNKITAKDTAVIGTAKPNTNVYVKIGSTIIGRGKVNSQGAFSITIPAQKLGTKISVVVMDGAGNYSPYKVIVVSN
ncbi:Ig-like domain-containing protein [Bacillus sp. DX1.1]|uniref:Ig-like domain-containing protein n=1 Tax=unclassified Bacillus (in: firmicutes) TaxID=185979 RepID=UPI002570E01E|nr:MULTISPECIES: Ig-like domain-containing protein [unclassified Bacillus (in: firmicutes)]MDM5154335.1 Ig-like domain-containing protein [Bacillus sp. DX1.1]WJE83246.1 Ig-like domain-containing protein [Bacillus sp. DX3.1]